MTSTHVFILAVAAVCWAVWMASLFYVAWYRHKTELLRLEARQAAERAVLEAYRRAMSRHAVNEALERARQPPCPCLTGCKSPACDK